jgi:hypothetical protein
MVKYNSNEFIVTGRWGDSLYVVKVTSNGDKVWEKYLYTSGGLFGDAIDKDAYGNFYIVVWKNTSSNQWLLIKFNSSGDTLWSRTIQDQINSFDIPYSIVVSSDYVYAASSAGNGPEKYILYKFDLDGNTLFSTTYIVPGGFSIPRSMTSDSDGNIIMAGTGGLGWYILKCNSNGDTLWSRTVTDNFWNNEARTVVTDDNDNIICSGWVNKIIKYDPDGNLIYDKPLGGDENWECAGLIKYDPENIISVGARRRANGMSFDLLLGKYSIGTGDSMWTDIWYYPDPSFGVYGWDGAVFFDNSLVVLAQTYNQVSGNFYSRIYLMSFLLADVPVSVELTSLTASVSGEDVLLNWTTATERNNKGFEVERKVSSHWETVGFVTGKGTTTEPQVYSFRDNQVSSGKYLYRLKQIDFDGTYKYSNNVEVSVSVPVQYSLSQNYPNPFNPSTEISFGLKTDAKVKLNVYNVLGQKVSSLINNEMNAGGHSIKFNASEMPSGIYFFSLEANGTDGSNFTSTKKMMLLK